MSYSKDHTEDDCDKCGLRLGKGNLRRLPFLYMDKNDKAHPDMSSGKMERGYRQYYACHECLDETTKRFR